MVSVAIVAEKDYLYKDNRDLAEIFIAKSAITSGSNAPCLRRAVRPVQSYWRILLSLAPSRRKWTRSDRDAFAFLDPVFSSGVFLGLRSGELAAEVVDAVLKEGDYSAERFAGFGEQICYGIESMRCLVYTFYDHAFSFRALINKYPQFAGDLTDRLMGRLFVDFAPLFEAVSDFAKVPPPLEHGSAVVGAR